MFLLPFSFFFFGLFSDCICTNVIYTSDAPKPFLWLSATKYPLMLFVYEENSPICLCVMYINVALYGIYIKPEECWYMNKIGARLLQGFLVVRWSLSLYMSVDRDKLGSLREGERSDLWDQPVLPPLRSVWRVLTLVWSLRCPLLLGVGSAWRRRTGDALVNHWQYYLLPLLLKVLLLWMTLSLTLESVGCRAQNEYIDTRCRIRPGQRSFIYLCFLFCFFLRNEM